MKKFKKVAPNPNFAEIEEKLLVFWKKNKIFEKTLKKPNPKAEFVFYDGPPFATGLPHYGHIVPGTLKDIVPRYWTMKGYKVERRFGWDCHGLPVEYQLEKELAIENKNQILEMGMGNFNEKCRQIVLRYTKEWEEIIPRLGRWVDFENDYKTMDPKYMESIWWVFKKLWEKGLIYEDYKSLHLCPRCQTPLSNFEVTLGYKEKKDLSLVVKFPLIAEKNTYALAWTTTPWTLAANVLLAVNPKAAYVKVKSGKNYYILAKERVKEIFKDKKIDKIIPLKAEQILGKRYKPLYDLADKGKKYYIAKADFVSLEEGTGIVHIAPAFGENDYLLGRREKAAFVQHINEKGEVNEKFSDYLGVSVWKLNKILIDDLLATQKIFSYQEIKHSYPFCWRCETPLLNYAAKTWFVAVEKIKDKLIRNNQKIYWMPKNIKNGRFGKWLENARDWAISRQRFWGTPIPVWKGNKGSLEVIGSIKELEEKTNKKINDLHLHKIIDLKWKNKKTGELMELSGEVLDCWFESGSMPYAFSHYPFENKDWFENHFPADFIAESIDQTRGWFYTLHVLAVALFDKPAFENVITNGVVLAEDGQKMSKSKKNFPDPMLIVKKYSADALRFYLMSSAVIKGKDLCFSEKGVLELVKGLFLRLWNVYRFFVTYAALDGWRSEKQSAKDLTILDKWLFVRLDEITIKITAALEKFNINQALSFFYPFIEDLSTWYLRRSRNRIGPNAKSEKDKKMCYAVLHTTLTVLNRLMAPFAPFISEEIYKNLTGEDSVHLSDWPKIKSNKINKADKKILENMILTRQICEAGHSQRKAEKIKVRQPLGKLKIKIKQSDIKIKENKELLELIKDELNVKKIEFYPGMELEVILDTKITPDLKKEGLARDIIRQIQEARKKAKCRLDEKIDVILLDWPKEHEKEIKNKTLAKSLKKGSKLEIYYGKRA